MEPLCPQPRCSSTFAFRALDSLTSLVSGHQSVSLHRGRSGARDHRVPAPQLSCIPGCVESSSVPQGTDPCTSCVSPTGSLGFRTWDTEVATGSLGFRTRDTEVAPAPLIVSLLTHSVAVSLGDRNTCPSALYKSHSLFPKGAEPPTLPPLGHKWDPRPSFPLGFLGPPHALECEEPFPSCHKQEHGG